MRLGDPKLIDEVRALNLGGALLREGTFHYVIFLDRVQMRPIIRRTTEWMTDTVRRRAASFDIVVNANLFDVPFAEKSAAQLGAGPFSPEHTTLVGQVVEANKVVAGPSSNRFYIAQILTRRANKKKPAAWRYEVIEGNPPTTGNTVAGVGGLGPLLSHGLPYGAQNRYKKGKTGPLFGSPSAEDQKNTLRNEVMPCSATGRASQIRLAQSY